MGSNCSERHSPIELELQNRETEKINQIRLKYRTKSAGKSRTGEWIDKKQEQLTLATKAPVIGLKFIGRRHNETESEDVGSNPSASIDNYQLGQLQQNKKTHDRNNR